LGNGRDDRHLAWGFYLPSITFPYIHRQPFLFFISYQPLKIPPVVVGGGEKLYRQTPFHWSSDGT
jgi:hypothetical protein